MDAVKNQPAWDEATERVMAYFARLEMGGSEHRTRKTLEIIGRARGRCAAEPSLHPVEAAMAEAGEALRSWYGGVLPGTAVETGMVAFLATGAGQAWPDAVLSDPPPADLAARLAGTSVSAGPALALSSMAAQDMNFGAMETLAQETWQKFDWAPVLRAAALWTAIFFLSLYAYDRFFAP